MSKVKHFRYTRVSLKIYEEKMHRSPRESFIYYGKFRNIQMLFNPCPRLFYAKFPVRLSLKMSKSIDLDSFWSSYHLCYFYDFESKKIHIFFYKISLSVTNRQRRSGTSPTPRARLVRYMKLPQKGWSGQFYLVWDC